MNLDINKDSKNRKREEEIKIYFEKSDELLKEQNYAGALNLLSKILSLNPENSKAFTKKLLIEDILKFRNIVIFSSTNLFMDPWA